MNWGLISSLTINGIAMGLVYGLMAMGLILLIRAVGVLNFSQGDFLSVGAFVGCSMLVDFQMPLPLAFLTSLVLYLLIGFLFMALVYWPVRKSSYSEAVIISTMGASIIIREVLMMIWGSQTITMPAVIQDPTSINGRSVMIPIGNTAFSLQYIVIFIVGILALFLVYMLFEKLYIGRMMQAASQDSYAAELIGIPTFITIAATYMISFALAGTAGFLIGPIFNVNVSLSTLQLFAFAGCVIGGVQNIGGAIIGAIFVGLIESYALLFNLSQYKQTIVFAVLLIFLIFKPNGLFRSKIGVKA